jgi:hypothetical protein
MPTLMGNDNSRNDYRRQQQAGDNKQQWSTTPSRLSVG